MFSIPEDEGELDRFIADCTESIDLTPDDVGALIQRGRAWYAKREYSRAIADFDKAIGWAPDRLDARYDRGLAFSARGEHHLAVADFSEAIRLGSEHERLAWCYYNRGRNWLLQEQEDQAIADLSDAIRLDPQHARSYCMRGLAQHGRGNDLLAIADFEQAIRHDPTCADAYHNRGNSWVQLGRYRRAVADFTQSILIDPDDPRSYNSRGVAWSRRGYYGKAITDYERALERDPQSPRRRIVLGGFLAGCPRRRYRDGRRAEQLCSEACELTDYCDADCLTWLAAAFAEQGDFEKATSFQTRALDVAHEGNDREGMLCAKEMYEHGIPWRMEAPGWYQRLTRSWR